MKKFMTKVVALAAAAVMSFGIVSAADVAWNGSFETKGPVEGGGGDKLTLDGLGIDYTKVDKVVVDIEVSSDYVNGAVGGNTIAKDGWDSTAQQEIKADAAPAKGSFVWEGIGGLKVGDDGNSGLQVQFWWINPIYGEDGETKEDGGTLKVTGVTIYDASGAVLYPAADPAPAPANDTPAPAPTDGGTPATGDATSVAILAVVALLAMGGVLVTSKKRA